MANALSATKKRELLALTRDQLTVTYITKNFTRSSKMEKDASGHTKVVTSEPHFNLRDRFTLEPGEYINTERVNTNVGKYLFNRIIIEGTVESVIPGHYYNTTFTNKSWGEIANLVSHAILEDKLDTDHLVQYLKRFEFYGLKLVACMSPSFTPAVLKPIPAVEKRKKELLAELAKNPNPTIGDYTRIDDELVELAKQQIGNDPGMALYKSGARGSFDNDYKINTLIVGPIKHPATGEYTEMTSDMMHGISKKDIANAGNMVVAASYPKAVGTAVGGYMTKQFYAVYQSVTISDVEDCGSKYTIRKKIDADSVESLMYQYMVENDKLICLTPEIADKYMGKFANFRTPMGCCSDQLCHVCVGDRFRRLNIENIGLTAGGVTNTLMNKQMKRFHEIKVKMNKVDPESLLL